MFFMGLLILFIGVAFLSPVATEEDDMSSELDEFDSIAGGSIGTSGGADNDDVVVDLEQQPYQGGRSRAHSRSRSSLRTFSLVLPTNAEGMRHEVRSSFVSRSGTGTTAGAAGNARNQNDTVSRSHTSRVSRSGTLSMARSPRSKGASQLVHRVERGFSLSMPMVSGHVLDHKRLAAHKASFRGMSSTSRSAKPMQHTQSMTVGRTNRLSNKMNVGDLLPKDSSRSDDEVDEKKNSLTSSNDTATNEHERKKMKAKHRTYSMY